MRVWICVWAIVCGVFTAAAVAYGWGADAGAETDELVKTIKAVGAEGRGNREAAQAWKELSRQKVTAVLEILAGLDDANPLAANYLRGAVEAIAEREIAAGGKLPDRELEKFVRDREHNPRARRLAYELLARVDSTAADRLIPGMLDDPSVEFRRDAVARLLAQAEKEITTEQKEEARGAYKTALAAARDDDQVQAIKKRLTELGEKVDLHRHFGFITTWRLVAPFDNTEKKGFHVAYPPEKSIDFAAEYEGKGGDKIRWAQHTTDNEYGIVDLAKTLSPFKGSAAYAAAEFVTGKEEVVDFRLGTPNSWKVWLNGELLFAREEYHRGMNLDQYKMRGTLKPGKNMILMKICQNEQTEDWAQRWQFQLRVCDATGTAILSADRTAKTGGASSGGE